MTPTSRPPVEPAPLVLYGYGSYEMSMDPYFSVSRLSLLDRGVVFAIAHVRGGGEMGRHWYDQGKTTVKKNTFTDFIAAGRHLVDTGWTSPDQLVATGGSAGGLLMGAVTNMAPDLFAGVSAHVPFVDALTSILMPELPLTVIEWEEWGDPTPRRGRLRIHALLFAVRERRRGGPPEDLGRDLAQRHPSPLRRTGQMGRPVA